MAPLEKRRIADQYMPSHWHYWYSLSKLTLDPLYKDVSTLLAHNRPPVLDVGCGIGLMLHCLRARGIRCGYFGIDIDAAKIEIARNTVVKGEVADACFQVCDLTCEFPRHRGSVMLLDVLQYLDTPAQNTLLHNAARCVAPDGKLVIRGALDDGSLRAALARIADRLGHTIRWMQPSFKAQPRPAELLTVLQQQGLDVEFRKPPAGTPFNNWLIVAQLRSASSAGRSG